MEPFRNILESDRIHVFDGAMGTMLYAKGIYINRCYDELNLSNPDLVREVHEEYRARRRRHHRNEHLRRHARTNWISTVWKKACARSTSPPRASRAKPPANALMSPARLALWVCASSRMVQPRSTKRRTCSRSRPSALLEGGVDLFVLETFSDVSEMRQAIRAVRELCDLPIVAQMTIQTDGNTVFGTTPELFTARLDEWGADVIGLNCGVGPAIILTALEKMRAVTKKKLVGATKRRLAARRSGPAVLHVLAGVHVEICQAVYPGGREVHRRLLRHDAGAHQVDFRRRARRFAARAKSALSSSGALAQVDEVDAGRCPGRAAGGTFELVAKDRAAASLSPRSKCCRRRAVDAQKTLDSIRLLKDAGVDGVNIPDGARAQSRMSALATAVLVEQQIGIESVLHYCCRDRNLLGMMSDLLGAAALGLRNLLLITGDPPKMGPYPDATAVFDIDAIGLTNMVNKLNHGLDLGNNPIGQPTAFCIGVGVNPGAINLEEEIRRFE